MKKTNLATHAEMAYDRLVLYLEWMQSRDLVKENDGLIHITEKGIKTYNYLVDWIITYVGKLKFAKER